MEVIKMKRTYLFMFLFMGIIHHVGASDSISKSLIGHWFVVQRNYDYSSGDSVNDEEKVTYNFVFNDDGSGYWMVETEKKHSGGKPVKNEQKFNYKWTVKDDKIVLDFFEMSKTVECNFKFSDAVLTLTDPENNTRKYAKK